MNIYIYICVCVFVCVCVCKLTTIKGAVDGNSAPAAESIHHFRSFRHCCRLHHHSFDCVLTLALLFILYYMYVLRDDKRLAILLV